MRCTVLTYNTHLFENTPAAFFAKTFKGIDLVAYDQQRADETLRRIVEVGPDVVCLQEVWSPDIQQELAQRLQARGYQSTFIPPNKPSDEERDGFVDRVATYLADLIGGGFIAKTALETLLPLVPDGVDLLTATSGLLIASRYPLAETKFQMYPDSDPDDSDDDLSKKGLASFVVQLPAEEGTIEVPMGTTHCFTNVEKACHQIQKYGCPTVLGDQSKNRILLGDFNQHVDVKQEYNALQEALRPYQAVDVLGQSPATMEDVYTVWTGGNMLSWLLASHKEGGQKPDGKKDRIDYVFFAPADGADDKGLKPPRAQVFHDWELKLDTPIQVFDQTVDTMPLSDHYPVFVELDLAGD